jgi:hypothetical protein
MSVSVAMRLYWAATIIQKVTVKKKKKTVCITYVFDSSQLNAIYMLRGSSQY